MWDMLLSLSSIFLCIFLSSFFGGGGTVSGISFLNIAPHMYVCACMQIKHKREKKSGCAHSPVLAFL